MSDESAPTPESLLQQREEQLALAEAQRDELQSQLTARENQIHLERRLTAAGVVDLEAATVLLGKRVDLQGEVGETELSAAVDSLLAEKPYLLPPAPAMPPATASPRETPATLDQQVQQAARSAIATGNRRDVAEYLRLRRAIAQRDGR